VIATTTKIEVSGLDKKLLEKVSDKSYFTKDKSEKKKGEDAFFKQGEKPEVSNPMRL
jgi:large subunit ribosomal protein L6e